MSIRKYKMTRYQMAIGIIRTNKMKNKIYHTV
jgi:hypothetical protein